MLVETYPRKHIIISLFRFPDKIRTRGKKATREQFDIVQTLYYLIKGTKFMWLRLLKSLSLSLSLSLFLFLSFSHVYIKCPSLYQWSIMDVYF